MTRDDNNMKIKSISIHLAFFIFCTTYGTYLFKNNVRDDMKWMEFHYFTAAQGCNLSCNEWFRFWDKMEVETQLCNKSISN